MLLLESGSVTLLNQSTTRVANIQDNSGELKSADLKAYIKSLGMQLYFFLWPMSIIRMDQLSH